MSPLNPRPQSEEVGLAYVQQRLIKGLAGEFLLQELADVPPG